MVFSRKEEKKILDFVQEQPHTIQEIAELLGNNWRTADSYVRRVATETGLINVRTFRGGTRGALKIVYWNALNVTESSYQSQLINKILYKTRKEEFSPFDIFQFDNDATAKEKDGFNIRAKEQLLIFSGNGSWIKDEQIRDFEKIAKSAQIKILLRVDLSSDLVVKKLLSINQKVGKDAISVRHAEHPLRGAICDNNAELKETLSPKDSRYRELEKPIVIMYSFEGKWASWLQKVFWKIWETSVDAQTRLEAIDRITVS